MPDHISCWKRLSLAMHIIDLAPRLLDGFVCGDAGSARCNVCDALYFVPACLVDPVRISLVCELVPQGVFPNLSCALLFSFQARFSGFRCVVRDRCLPLCRSEPVTTGLHVIQRYIGVQGQAYALLFRDGPWHCAVPRCTCVLHLLGTHCLLRLPFGKPCNGCNGCELPSCVLALSALLVSRRPFSLLL